MHYQMLFWDNLRRYLWRCEAQLMHSQVGCAAFKALLELFMNLAITLLLKKSMTYGRTYTVDLQAGC